jgi:23S rRNA (cytosine1962-C5)-methyltransferase
MPVVSSAVHTPVVVAARGAARLAAGHPWVYRSDVLQPAAAPGFAPVHDPRGRPLGWAAVHPSSQIAVRLVHPHDTPVTASTLTRLVGAALDRREALVHDPHASMEGVTGYRCIHAEADDLPGLVVDRLGSLLVVQNGCAALEPHLDAIVATLRARLSPEGVLGRFDSAAREREGLPRTNRVLYGTIPDQVVVSDGLLTWRLHPGEGQKTGAFLDQRLNHRRLAAHARGSAAAGGSAGAGGSAAAGGAAGAGGSALDVFSYHGGFGLHLLRAGATSLELVDASAAALDAARVAAADNGLPAPTVTRADAFAYLRALEREGKRFDVIALDPPALAKRARDLPRALAGYKELNLRAMRLLRPGGVLGTASCSAHVQEAEFLNVLSDAAADAGRTMHVLGRFGAAPDHPERLGFPESAYLKFVLLRAIG